MMYLNRLSEARTGLLDKLKEYFQITGVHIRVVFDGKKEQGLNIKSERDGVIDVYFSLEYSADFLIKQFIRNDINPRMTTVVTSDKDIINYVSRYKAKVRTSEDFARLLNETITRWYENQIPEKDDNPVLSKEEISFWENLFKKNKK